MNDITTYKDQHLGETGIVVGNAPSLCDVPLEFLRKYPTIGTNLIWLHEAFEPTYYTVVDPGAVRGPFIKRVNAMGSVKFIGVRIARKYPDLRNYIPLNTITIHHAFTYDLANKPLWEGWSVTFVALQLAHWMGFKTVLMVGVDHRYNGEGSNHFHPDYENDWVYYEHDMTKAIPAYIMARRAFDKQGRKVINLTPGSDLHVFPMGDISEWL